MSLKHVVEKKPDHLVLIFEGTFNGSTIPEFTEAILQACRDHRPTKLLADVRQVTGQLQTLERFRLGEFFSQKFTAAVAQEDLPYCRFVVLGNAPLIDPDQFGALVASNRGATARATTDPEEALRWLLSGAS